ncbi:hypothetical protein JCM6882_004386 [Rhodosporidiobolus microsporus]
MSAAAPTPSSEIIHLVSAFTDALDSLPPSLTRSLSDLKELDAVLNSSLQTITDKLRLLREMMHTPEPGSKEAAVDGSKPPKYTPLDRLKLLREVADDARVFRLGGEDKIRVATNTCETISTHTSHLSTLSTLLLGFLPAHLLPHLPAPSAPHGYPQSNTSLRGRYDYSAARHPGQGGTSRLGGALGMVREHYDLTRGAAGGAGGRTAAGVAGGKKRAAQIDYSIYGDDYGVGAGASRAAGGGAKDKDPSQRHPNQYTKKRLQAAAAAGGGAGYGAAVGGIGGAVSAAATNAATGVYALPQHQHYQYQPGVAGGHLGVGGVGGGEGAKEMRRREESGAGLGGVGGAGGSAMSVSGAGSRAGSVGVGGAQGGGYYVDEYAAQGGRGGGAKRKGEEVAGGNKRRKKGVADSPDPSARTLPASAFASSSAAASGAATSRAPRRQNSTSTRGGDEPPSPAPAAAVIAQQHQQQHAAHQHQQQAAQQQQYLPAAGAAGHLGGGGEEEFVEMGDDDEQDKTLYCFCQRVSFGEMIACDAPDCEHEWFHLPCVGLKSIPDGRWFCDECRRTLKAGKKGRR